MYFFFHFLSQQLSDVKLIVVKFTGITVRTQKRIGEKIGIKKHTWMKEWIVTHSGKRWINQTQAYIQLWIKNHITLTL